MRSDTVFWHSTLVARAIQARAVGDVIRLAREQRGWSQQYVAARAGYSRSTVSRIESGHLAAGNLPRLRAITDVLGMPDDVFAAVAGITSSRPATVGRTAVQAGEDDDPMRRRSLLAGGLALPVAALTAMDDALAVMPVARPAELPALLRDLTGARAHYDAGRIRHLLDGLPSLLAAGHATAESGDPNALIVLSTAYGLAAEALTKLGVHDQARLAADRGVGYAERSHDELTRALADRQLGIVLRHEGRHVVAAELTQRAADRIERTGLKTRAQTAAYAQMLCTAAYSAAQSGDRARALDMIGDATRAARMLPATAPAAGPLGAAITRPGAALYRVSVHWALGDAGHALEVGRDLRPDMFPTAERRARLHIDLARAWWQRRDAERAADRLLSAFREAPLEVRDRPTVRALARQIISGRPHAVGVRELATTLRTGSQTGR